MSPPSPRQCSGRPDRRLPRASARGPPLAELRRLSTEFKGALHELAASYAVHVELLDAAAAEHAGLLARGAAGVDAARPQPLSLGHGELGEASDARRCASDDSLAESAGQDSDDCTAHRHRASADSLPPTPVRIQDPAVLDAELTVVDVYDFWKRDASCGDGSAQSPLDLMRSKARQNQFAALDKMMTRSNDNVGGIAGKRLMCRPIRPDSLMHVTWVVFSLVVITYDVISLPLGVSFQLDGELFFTAMDMVGRAFWTLDIGMNFLTGFYNSGRIELRFLNIARKYTRTWFFPDLAVVTFDWASLIMVQPRGSGVVRLAKFPRWSRLIVRAARMFRIITMVKVAEDAAETFVSDAMGAVAGILRLLCHLVVFNHFVACGWHFMATHSHDTSWLDSIEHESTFYRYVVSFHWSMAQYTPAPSKYHPTNLSEWLYACVVLLFGIAVFSSFLGKITSTLTLLGSYRAQRSREDRKLRQYLLCNKVTTELSARIGSFMRDRKVGERPRPTYSEVTCFRTLPASLLMEVKWQSYSPTIRAFPLFEIFTTIQISVLYRLCLDGITELSCSWGDELFHAGSQAERVLFVKHGQLHYSRGNTNLHAATRDSSVSNQARNLMNKVASRAASTGASMTSLQLGKLIIQSPGPPDLDGDVAGTDVLVIGDAPSESAPYPWICEVALWCGWTHHGTLFAKSKCVVLALDAKAVHDVAAQDVLVYEGFRAYARAFARELGWRFTASAQADGFPEGVDDYFGGDRSQEFAQMAKETIYSEMEKLRDRPTREFGWSSTASLELD